MGSGTDNQYRDFWKIDVPMTLTLIEGRRHKHPRLNCRKVKRELETAIADRGAAYGRYWHKALLLLCMDTCDSLPVNKWVWWGCCRDHRIVIPESVSFTLPMTQTVITIQFFVGLEHLDGGEFWDSLRDKDAWECSVIIFDPQNERTAPSSEFTTYLSELVDVPQTLRIAPISHVTGRQEPSCMGQSETYFLTGYGRSVDLKHVMDTDALGRM